MTFDCGNVDMSKALQDHTAVFVRACILPEAVHPALCWLKVAT